MTRKKVAVIASAMGLLTGGSFVAGMAVAKAPPKEPVTTMFSEQNWMATMKEGELPAIAAVEGDPFKGGAGYLGFLKLPANFVSPPHAHSSDYWSILIQGQVAHWAVNGGSETNAKKLGIGGTTFMPAKVEHVSKCYPGTECVMVVMQKGKFDFLPGKAAPAATKTTPAPAAATKPAAAPAKPAK